MRERIGPGRLRPAPPRRRVIVEPAPPSGARSAQLPVAAGPAPLGPVQRVALPATLREGMERVSGIALDDVQVYRNSFKPARLQAHAFAQGDQIHLGPGQDRHLPHELAHIVQQRQGRVPTTGRIGGQPLNDDARLETDADAMAARAAQASGPRGPGPTGPAQRRSAGSAPIQCYRMVGTTKISNGGRLALVGPHDLYAGDAQFSEANTLKGMVAFDKGPRLAPGTIADVDAELHRVEARLKPNSGNKGFATGARGEIVIPPEDEVRSGFEAANSTAETNSTNRDAYCRRDDDATGIQLPSDCGFTAQYVTGLADKGEPSSSVGMKAGSIYDYHSMHKDREWSHHSAGVIMTDGSDHITMENAAAMASEKFDKREIDRSWWYDMFGPEAPQRFEDKYERFLPEGTLRRHHKVGAFEGLLKKFGFS